MALKHTVFKRDHYQVMTDVYDDEFCASFYFPHKDMQQAFVDWYLNQGGEKSFLEFRGPIIEKVEDAPDEPN